MPLNIMVVDDSPVRQISIPGKGALMGPYMGECSEAADGEEALTSLHERWIDLTLTDVNMPRVNGEEFVRRVGVRA